MSIIRKKLIEVALPLEAINTASAREKSIRHGHPSTLHLWWARRPLAAARAVIFAQMVDDPSAWPDLFPTEKKQEQERQRLFRIIEDLVKWENTTNQAVLQRARDEIWRSWRRACAENVGHPQAKELFDREKLPAFHDPFAGGGALPLEAQRFGLEAYASDLNPVAVLINKAMIEIPPKFTNNPPVNPEVSQTKTEWHGAEGLAEDVRYYGKWMRDEAEKRIGHLYPKVKVTSEMVAERPDLQPYLSQDLTVIAWIWARTVKSPNPAFRDVDVPLVSSFMLSSSPGKEAYVKPVIENGDYCFSVNVGKPADIGAYQNGTKLARANFSCLLSKSPISGEYIKAEGMAGRIGARLMAVVAEGNRGRVYLSPTIEQQAIAQDAKPTWKPEGEISARMTGGNCTPYGLTKWGDLFTNRQLVALTEFTDLVEQARERVMLDSNSSEYADAVATYLAFAIDRMAMTGNSLVRWNSTGQKAQHCFGRQGLPMLWDFAETNFFAEATGSAEAAFFYSSDPLSWMLPMNAGFASQQDAAVQSVSQSKLISTDPPYYDNVGYADLSDFFYVWLRRSLRVIYPALFGTMAVPKAEELVATAYRHGGRASAEQFFLTGMTKAMHRLCEQSHPAFPVTIYYAFKQSETTDSGGQSSSGWETFLEAVSQSGFAITGTWPVRTEMKTRQVAMDTNALASSIILVCRRRTTTAPSVSRRDFLSALDKELPSAITDLQRGNVAPVDLQQAAIGPGMAIFTRYAQVLGADGKPLSVRDALMMINQALDEVLAEQEGDFDGDTRWALSWFEQYGFAEGDYGVAETLSKAKNTSVQGVVEAGMITSGRGKVRLLRPEELEANWTPAEDKRLTVWDMVHHLVRVLDKGEDQAAALLAKLGTQAEVARELAYRLYALCNKTKRSQDAQRYNTLVQSWPELLLLAQQLPKRDERVQQTLEGME